MPAIFSKGNAADPVATDTARPEPPGIGIDTSVPVPPFTGAGEWGMRRREPVPPLTGAGE